MHCIDCVKLKKNVVGEPARTIDLWITIIYVNKTVFSFPDLNNCATGFVMHPLVNYEIQVTNNISKQHCSNINIITK